VLSTARPINREAINSRRLINARSAFNSEAINSRRLINAQPFTAMLPLSYLKTTQFYFSRFLFFNFV
jgi:hypothetical protein